jgi:hypothetical protein
MENQPMDVLRYEVTDLAAINGYLDMDTSETETILTAISGRVSGELDRVVTREEDGGLVLSYVARIDGFEDGIGVARVESTSSDELECLAAVAAFLAREISEPKTRDPFDIPTSGQPTDSG